MATTIISIETPLTTVSIEGGQEVLTIEAESPTQITTITQEGIQGPNNIPKGGQARQVITKIDATEGNIEWRSNWYDYAMNVEYNGVEATIASGDILECIIDGNTIYRFINNTNGANGYPIEDSFYTNFDGTNLTNLIVSRG
jgi:hypothetical protein